MSRGREKNIKSKDALKAKMEEQEIEEEMPIEEMAEDAHTKIDALIELLVKKGIITEEEFEKSYDSFFEEE